VLMSLGDLASSCPGTHADAGEAAAAAAAGTIAAPDGGEWLWVLDSVLPALNDKDKVRQAAYRAIGQLIRLINFSATLVGTPAGTPGSSDLLNRTVAALAAGFEEGTAKTQWNVCYAAVQLYVNPTALIPVEGGEKLLLPMVERLARSPNIKLRAHAALAVACAPISWRRGGMPSSGMLAKVVEAAHQGLEDHPTVEGPQRPSPAHEVRYLQMRKRHVKSLLEHLEDLGVAAAAEPAPAS